MKRSVIIAEIVWLAVLLCGVWILKGHYKLERISRLEQQNKEFYSVSYRPSVGGTSVWLDCVQNVQLVLTFPTVVTIFYTNLWGERIMVNADASLPPLVAQSGYDKNHKWCTQYPTLGSRR